MRRAFRVTKVILIAIVLWGIFPYVSADLFEEDYDSEYVYVLNREEGDEVLTKNHKNKAYPASLTKIMTTLVALEHIENLSEVAPVDIYTYREMVNQNASMAGFYGKEQTTYRDLLYGTILSSGGEAANSLAIHVGGSKEKFVKKMNEKAAEIGLENTHFTNPEGFYDRKQYTTAADMGRLLDYALNDGNFRAIFTKPTFQTTSTLDHPDGVHLQSTVLSKLDDYSQESFRIIGGKSGTTYEAGQCWITLGTKNDVEYIVVVMGSKFKDISQPGTEHIMDTLKIYEEIE